MSESQHPSRLALDRLALGAAPPEVAAHVAACAVCQGRTPQSPPEGPLPAWARDLGPRVRPPLWARAWAGRARVLAVSFAAAACLALVWTVGIRPGDHTLPPGTTSPDYVGTKGAPAVRLFVKRGERVDEWNGVTPIQPGDLLRLTVSPDRFAHVTVFEETKSPASHLRLYEAPLAPGRATALPLSWKVDARPGDDTLLVVLGPDAVSPSQVAAVLADANGARHWWRRLVLVKATSP